MNESSDEEVDNTAWLSIIISDASTDLRNKSRSSFISNTKPDQRNSSLESNEEIYLLSTTPVTLK